MSDSDFERLLVELRPKLHRYCARMTGLSGDRWRGRAPRSACQGGQSASARGGEIAQPERWLFRIAHNAALDFLRRRAEPKPGKSNEDPGMIVDPEEERPDPELVSTELAHVHAGYRPCSTAAADLDGRSGLNLLGEIGTIMDASVPAVKSALHRGRTQLHEIATEPDMTLRRRCSRRANAPCSLCTSTASTPATTMPYGRCWPKRSGSISSTAGSSSARPKSRTTSATTQRYRRRTFALGYVDGHPALLVYERATPDVVSYFILLSWSGSSVTRIRDFIHAPYALDGAVIVPG